MTAECPLCGNPIDPAKPFVVCPKDSTPHHADCWQAFGKKCGSFGCGYSGELPSLTIESKEYRWPGNSFHKEGGLCPYCKRRQIEDPVCPFCRRVLHPSLVWVRDDGSYTAAPFRGNPLNIGRRPDDNDLAIQSESVSRCHATVTYDADLERCFIRDLNSKNGTWVNGRQIRGKTDLPTTARIDIAGVATIFVFLAGQTVPPHPGDSRAY